METFNAILSRINDILWHDFVLFVVLGVGTLLLIWTRFAPWLALTHGVQVVRGKYDSPDDPGAINHFQALSAALSATIGLGNIGGVAVAISLGGPGAVFWMWMVGIVGMALKTVEVTQSMLYRNTTDPDNPHGGPMFVASRGMAEVSPSLAVVGRWVGYVFCVTLLISTVTGGNMFQAWNVGNVTELNFGIPEIVTGLILAVITALVIIGGIKRIGAVAGKLVPFMCIIYLLAAFYVLAVNFSQIPSMIRLIFVSAFSPTEAQGAFLGGTMGYAFLWGMKRALFSNEAGQGSAPIAHAAAQTDEPVREGVVAGMGPFIDTIVVCTLTALVILSSGAWNRAPEGQFSAPPEIVETAPGEWTIESGVLITNDGSAWTPGQDVFMVLGTGTVSTDTNNDLFQLHGLVEDSGSVQTVRWSTFSSPTAPTIADPGVHVVYTAASLTSHAFDRVQPGLGRWLVTLAAWLFAISTMISWSYYGEQGVVFLLGARWINTYKIVYCILILVATSGIVTTDAELDALTSLGTGVMLFANIPIILLFSRRAMREYHDYRRRLFSGEMLPDR